MTMAKTEARQGLRPRRNCFESGSHTDELGSYMGSSVPRNARLPCKHLFPEKQTYLLVRPSLRWELMFLQPA